MPYRLGYGVIYSSGGDRTPDILVNSQALYQLSYARMIHFFLRAGDRNRTRNLLGTGQALYQLSYTSISVTA